MFERALREFPQFSPVALSTNPYVVQFDDIVRPEEAAAIIDIAKDRLARSLAGDQVSPVRTSTQFWCDDSDGCTRNADIVRVTERMMNVTQLPVDNAEYMQILRYEPGQFYKQHHDQQTAHWTPQGVRVYTFLVYLSDVEAGGGTKFNDLGLVVEPKLGRAVLWPSVIADDLLTGERKTHHEALAVDRGIKYAANLWMHLYDFKTPSRAGICPFLGQNTHSGA
jgi:predicted 2-oxoglutarate/Fe(II)-dependent dioxygenase YbiX